MLKNGSTYIENLALWTSQDVWSMLGDFLTLCLKGLRNEFVKVIEKTKYQVNWGKLGKLSYWGTEIYSVKKQTVPDRSIDR